MPSKQRILKKRAMRYAEMRGHKFERNWQGDKPNGDRFFKSCTDCGNFVDVVLKPMPNEIELGGEALAMDCPGYQI